MTMRTADQIIAGWRNVGDVAPELLVYARKLENERVDLLHALKCVAIGKPYQKRAADLLRELGEL